MASDIATRTARNNNDELRQIQEQHQRRKEKIVKSNEEQIRDLEDKYRQKKSTTQAENRAAINHIKENTRQQIDTTRTYSEQQLNKIKKNYELRSENERQLGEKKIEGIRTRADGQATRFKTEIQTEEVKAKNKRRAIQEQTKLFEEHHQFRKKLAHNSADLKIQQISDQNQEAISRVRQRGQSETERLRKHFETQQQEVQTVNRQKIQKNQKETAELLKSLMETQQQKEHLEKVAHNQRVAEFDNQTKAQLQKTKERGEIDLQKVKQENNTKFLAQDKQFREKESELKKTHSDEIQRIHKEGDHLLFQEKTRLESDRNRLNAQHKTALENEIKNFQIRKNQQETAYTNLLAKNDEVFRKNLKTQKESYEKQVEVNKALNQEVLDNQNSMFRRELIRRKSQLMDGLSKYANVGQDPFYKIPDMNAELIENEDRYTLKARIPEHERGNVDVRVQKDKIVLSGKREFSEDLSSEDESQRLKTSNYQTYRQEFRLAFPIYERAVTETYENGVLTVTIPKVGFSQKI